MEELVIKVRQPVPAVPEARLVRGGVGTGKTELLVGRVRGLVAGGVDPYDVLAVCATPRAAVRFRERLVEAGLPGEEAAQVEVVSARELELLILADARARQHTGREPRLLTDAEERFLLEDLKVGGVVGRRLRELLKFLRRSMTEFSDEDEGFLIDGDEIDVTIRLKTTLAMTGGVLACELPELAAQCVRDMPDLRADLARPHVVVDDYQLLCRASQVLTSHLATESLVVAGDADGCREVFEPYPYAAGLDEFVEEHPGCAVDELAASHGCGAVRGAVNALRADPDLGCAPLASGPDAPGQGAARVERFEDATDELRGVAGLVGAALERGVRPEEVAVCVPNRLWASNVVRALGGPQACASAYELPTGTGGDVEGGPRSAAARELALLLLAGDASDGMAWRAWCGFGSPLGRSGAFDVLRDRSDATGAHLSELLVELVGEPDWSQGAHRGDLHAVAEAYRAGLDALGRLHGLVGEELLAAIAREIGGPEAVPSRELSALCGRAAASGACAAELCAQALGNLALPGREPVGGRVFVGPAESLVGLTPRVLVFCGCMDGFLPGHDFFETTRTVPGKVHAARAAALTTACATFGKARDELVCTYAASMDVELAGRLDLRAERIYVAPGGRRMAALSPSLVLAAAGLKG